MLIARFGGPPTYDVTVFVGFTDLVGRDRGVERTYPEDAVLGAGPDRSTSPGSAASH